MTRLPGTGLPAKGIDSSVSLVICGENPADVVEATDKRLSEWHRAPLSVGFREFNIYQYTKGHRSLVLMVGGLGSASVELLLQEGTIAGIKKFLLGGTCASLTEKMPVGELAVPTRVIFRPGSLNEYIDTPSELVIDSRLQRNLIEFLKSKRTKFLAGAVVSTDAFYGIGAAVNPAGQAVYAGARMKNGKSPKALPLAVENKSGADMLDMECAPFFGFGHIFEDIEVAGLKVPTNRIPWSENDFHDTTVKEFLTYNIHTLIDFALSTDI